MIVSYSLQPVVTWVTITNNPGAGGAPPTLAIAASVSAIADTEDSIVVTVSNSLGDSVNATCWIYVRQTDWQKLRAIGIMLSAAIGILTSVLGTFLYWPHIVNAILGRRLVKKCPLHHTTPRFQFPEGTVRFECSVRGDMKMCGVDLYKGIDFINHYIYNRFTLKPTPNSRPPVWLNVQDRRMVLVLPPPPEDHVGIKVVVCRFWKSKNFLLEEFEANYDACYDGYVYDENQIKRNEMFTGEKTAPLSVAVPIFASAPAASNAKMNALELELTETKAMQDATDRRLQREMRENKKRDEENKKEMVQMRDIIKQLLEGPNGGSATATSPKNRFSASVSSRYDLDDDDDDSSHIVSPRATSNNKFRPSASGAHFNASMSQSQYNSYDL